MKLKYLIIILLLGPFGVQGVTPTGEFRPGSYLFDQVIIRGTTNVNQFQLSYRENHFTSLPETNRFLNENLKISIPADEIEAESKVMLDDFLELINASHYPTINISISHQITGELLNRSNLRHNIRVTMNGVTNTYTCSSEIEKTAADQWYLNGKMNVLLTDFGIEPPKKFLGIVKVRDEVFISFKILFSTEKN
ncbi:MAG: YceI family protein [Mangrovibacterium sp.]